MEGYQYRTYPYDHQRTANLRAWLKKSFAWFMEMGTGKTKVAIDEMTALWETGLIDAVIVLAPKGSYMNWVNTEFPTHMPERVYDSARIVEWRPGGGSKTHQELLVALCETREGSLPILVMNVEALSSGTHGYVFINRFADSHKRIAIYVDESTSIRSPDATRTKRVIEVGKKCLYRRILTGYAAPRSPLDLYSQFDFLGTKLLGYTSYYAFRSRYAVLQQHTFGGRKCQVVVGYRDIEELTRRLEPHSYRVTKDECLDLPPKIYSAWEVEMTDEQQRIYTSIRENATAALGKLGPCSACTGGYRRLMDNGDVVDVVCNICGGSGEVAGAHVTATEVITQILRLHQVLCGHVNDETGASHDVPSNRISELMKVLAEADSKTIIWARYRRDIELIVAAVEKEFGKDTIVQYHGGVGQADRDNALFRFQGSRPRVLDGRIVGIDKCPDNHQARFFVGNAQTGGFGLTLTAAKTVVYYSNDYDLEKRIQSEDRAHRSGQTKSVNYVDLVVRGTVDEKIIKALRAKINIGTLIMGDKYREWLI